MHDYELPEHIAHPNPEIYLGENYESVDLETTNLEKGSALNERNKLILTCGGNRGRGYNSWWGNEYQANEQLESINAAAFIIAHNAKFELQWFKRAGADISSIIVWDTMVAENVIAGNRRWPLDLQSVARRYGVGGKQNVVSLMIKAGVCPSEIPREWLEEYCIQDVVLAERIFRKQLQYCIENNLLAVVYSRCLLTPVLSDIEFNGICLDKQLVQEEYTENVREYLKLNTCLEQFSGGLNWNSPPQVASFIYDELRFAEPKDWRGNPIRTDTGKRSASAENIKRLQARNKRQREFIEIYAKRNKIKSLLQKNLEFFKGVVDEKEGIFKANFNQCIARTHRLTSSGRPIKFEQFPKPKSVQFQNLPRACKPLFRARYEGWLIGETDGAQLEFRVAAFLGNDTTAASDIREGFDVHNYSAEILGCSRQEAKAYTFKPLYGGRSGTERQQEYYRSFREKYNGIATTQKGWVDTVVGDKQLTTITGLVFYWPDTKIQRSGYVTNNESIHNYPVQSFATADIIPIAVVYQYHRMRAANMESFMVNTVHDSSICEINPKERELFESIAVKAYTSDVYEYLRKVYGIEFDIPLGAGVKIGTHWGTGEEIKHELEPKEAA
jgi:DNA polymerase I-like protein with 3'-5' exonuclease and polymerase domains